MIICAAIVVGRKAPAHQRTRRGLKFGAVKAAYSHVTRYKGIAAHYLSDLLRLKLFTHFTMNRVYQGRWSKHGTARIDATGLHPVVIDLREDARTLFVNRAGHTPVCRYNVGIKTMYQFLIGPVTRVD